MDHRQKGTADIQYYELLCRARARIRLFVTAGLAGQARCPDIAARAKRRPEETEIQHKRRQEEQNARHHSVVPWNSQFDQSIDIWWIGIGYQ